MTRRVALTAAALMLVSAGVSSADPNVLAPAWSPNPTTDGLKAFEGIEVDRGNKFPERKGNYIVVQGDYYRFNVWKNDRDTTGGGDRQRTESKGMVQNGSALKLKKRRRGSSPTRCTCRRRCTGPASSLISSRPRPPAPTAVRGRPCPLHRQR